MSHLQPVYLANIILFIQRRSTLETFEKVSKTCQNHLFCFSFFPNISTIIADGHDLQSLSPLQINKIYWLDLSKTIVHLPTIPTVLYSKIINVRIDIEDIPELFYFINLQKVVIHSNNNYLNLSSFPTHSKIKRVVFRVNSLSPNDLFTLHHFSLQFPLINIFVLSITKPNHDIPYTQNLKVIFGEKEVNEVQNQSSQLTEYFNQMNLETFHSSFNSSLIRITIRIHQNCMNVMDFTSFEHCEYLSITLDTSIAFEIYLPNALKTLVAIQKQNQIFFPNLCNNNITSLELFGKFYFTSKSPFNNSSKCCKVLLPTTLIKCKLTSDNFLSFCNFGQLNDLKQLEVIAKVSSMDISQNVGLTYISIKTTSLTFTITPPTKMEHLSLYGNQLKIEKMNTLNVNHLVMNGKINMVNLSGCTNLSILNIHSNSPTTTIIFPKYSNEVLKEYFETSKKQTHSAFLKASTISLQGNFLLEKLQLVLESYDEPVINIPLLKEIIIYCSNAKVVGLEQSLQKIHYVQSFNQFDPTTTKLTRNITDSSNKKIKVITKNNILFISKCSSIKKTTPIRKERFGLKKKGKHFELPNQRIFTPIDTLYDDSDDTTTSETSGDSDISMYYFDHS
ncbi:Leucine-rich repeat containing protein [Entamoeba marina]